MLTFVLLTVSLAFADSQSEYARLSSEMERLSTRGSWDGVERSYQRCLELGVDISYEDHLYGAHAARDAGNIVEVKERLQAALDVRPDREAADWLSEIEKNYGAVELYTLPGIHALIPNELPFEAGQVRAIEFAQARVDEDGQFVGFLPNGLYTFGDYDLDVTPRIQARELNLLAEAQVLQGASKKAQREEAAAQRGSVYGVSIEVGPIQFLQWGVGVVVREAREHPRFALVTAGGVDPALFTPSFSGGVRGYPVPSGVPGFYADLQYGALVWAPLPPVGASQAEIDSAKMYMDGVSLGLGLESAGLGLALADGLVSLDANAGVGYCPRCELIGDATGSSTNKIAMRGGVALSINLGP
ncbi:MAG: hypothetical protein JXX28_01620 [Deltaproteobacteria bacterium]|nr:hypothetical protein [Deltaproteobacteria bacterium]